jgi:hypothetical protein
VAVAAIATVLLKALVLLFADAVSHETTLSGRRGFVKPH